MSTELTEFSEMLDEKFEIADIETGDPLWEAVLNLFITFSFKSLRHSV